jgi:hypothetical protein
MINISDAERYLIYQSELGFKGEQGLSSIAQLSANGAVQRSKERGDETCDPHLALDEQELIAKEKQGYDV